MPTANNHKNYLHFMKGFLLLKCKPGACSLCDGGLQQVGITGNCLLAFVMKKKLMWEELIL